ncbi:MAG: DUF177 domain-containing protein [Candidatus Promineifilaceae bacterium]
MSKKKYAKLKFNFGFLLEADLGTSREYELDYPIVYLEDDVVLTPLTGKFSAIRNSRGIYITGQLYSEIEGECSRCLDTIQIPITIQLDDLFYYPPSTTPPGEFSVGEDCFIDLAPLARQMSLLDIPMQPICKPDCKGLCGECGQNLNEGSCDCAQDDIDPRMAVLKSLLDS